MRFAFYVTGTVMLALGGAGIGVLAWLARGWYWYAAGLPLLWFLLTGGWALLSVSADDRFRLRVGHAVAFGGLVGLLVQLIQFGWFALAWAGLTLSGGLFVAWRRGPLGRGERRSVQVKPPLTRRG